MREERGTIAGDVVVNELFTVWGMIAGTVRVVNKGKLYLRGSIYGNLVVEPGGRVHIFGNVQGNLLIMKKTKVILSGNVGGDIINKAGRLYIERAAKVIGKVQTGPKAETTYEGRSSIRVK
jgi:cytoskeletal protein CcmA (bactofilin family)